MARFLKTFVCSALGVSGVLLPSVVRGDSRASVDAPAPAGDVATWVDGKVEQCAPKPEERRFDQTGWLTDIRSALALAKQSNRPVFLFTHDGRIGLGRC